MFATAILVFLRAFQQKNVMGQHYFLAALTSFLIAFAEVTVIVGVVKTEWDAAPWIGTGGAIGVVLAMMFHEKLVSYFEKIRTYEINRTTK